MYDVGRLYDPNKERYDHHQPGAPKRENGITYCGFGLVWKKYGTQYCDGNAKLASLLDQELVMPIDANDNGQTINEPTIAGQQSFTIDVIIKSFNPQFWVDESETYDGQFFKAVELAKVILHRYKVSCADKLLSQKEVLGLYHAATDKRMIIVEKNVSVSGVLDECPELLYVVSPRQNGTWSVLAVPDKPGSYVSRRPFPNAWRSKVSKELVQVSGVADAIFCHATGFLAVATTRSGAIKLAQQAFVTA